MHFVFLGVVFCRTDFLQILGRPKHPCRQLAIPLIGFAKDLHLLVKRPAGRTNKKKALVSQGFFDSNLSLNQLEIVCHTYVSYEVSISAKTRTSRGTTSYFSECTIKHEFSEFQTRTSCNICAVRDCVCI